MTKFHTDALEAEHTQRELDEIPQRVREQHEAELGPDPRHATLRLLRAELAAEKSKEAKARKEAQLLTQAIYRVRKELGV